ncbi:MAG TPA: hypothetical protein VFC70_05465, partial [Oscillospiraceae bacterium]|nr:hypothetical protein [Oscillospiraceae bacterium]
IKELHENTKDTIYKDIEYFTNYAVKIKSENGQDLDKVLEIVDILMKTVATLENTKAVII